MSNPGYIGKGELNKWLQIASCRVLSRKAISKILRNAEKNQTVRNDGWGKYFIFRHPVTTTTTAEAVMVRV